MPNVYVEARPKGRADGSAITDYVGDHADRARHLQDARSRTTGEKPRSPVGRRFGGNASKTSPPAWIKPQVALLVKEAPDGPEWLHEIKYDGYRVHARIDCGDVQLLTRSGLDWTHKYPSIAESLRKLDLGSVYLDGELCALNADGTTSFSGIQAATDTSVLQS
jgi:ATP-dependent DNA ligase